MPHHVYQCPQFNLDIVSVPQYHAATFDFTQRQIMVPIQTGLSIRFFIHVQPLNGFDPTNLRFGFVQIVKASSRRSYYRNSAGNLGQRRLLQYMELDGNPAAPNPIYEPLDTFLTNPFAIDFEDRPVFVNESNFQDSGRWLCGTEGFDEFALFLIVFDGQNMDDVVNVSWRISWNSVIRIDIPAVLVNQVQPALQGWNQEDFNMVPQFMGAPHRANHPASIHEFTYNNW
jgi:hypothetical protein